MILGRTPEGLIKIKKDEPLGLRAVNCACCGGGGASAVLCYLNHLDPLLLMQQLNRFLLMEYINRVNLGLPDMVGYHSPILANQAWLATTLYISSIDALYLDFLMVRVLLLRPRERLEVH